jgi:nucleoside-diphosphate-sugar epimerase
MENILITGSTGFLGNQILKSIIKFKDKNIFIVVRNHNNINPNLLNAVKFVYYTENIWHETAEWWFEICTSNSIDTIIHCAWHVEPGKYDSELNLSCIIGSLSLVMGARRGGVKRVIGIGSAAEYQRQKMPLSTKTPLKPESLYGITKSSLFEILNKYCELNSIEFLWLRVFNLYGEGENEKRFLSSYLRTKLDAGEIAELTSGNQIRDFLDVKKASEMIIKVSLSQKIGVLNICSGIPITIRQFAEKIADEYGRRDLLKFGSRPDNSNDPEYVVGVVDDFFK